MKKYISILALILAACLLCGCQAQTPPVMTATEPTIQSEEKAPVSEEDLTTSDGRVVFTMDLELPQGELSAVDVTPHVITGEEAKHVAQLLLPDAVFYERFPSQSDRLSREEIQRKIDFYSLFTGDALNEGYGKGIEGIYEKPWRQAISDALSYWQEQLKTPNEAARELCNWKFKPTEYYYPEYSFQNLSEMLDAQTEVGNLDYTLFVNAGTMNSITLGFPTGMDDLEDMLYRSQLCRTPEPTQDQVDAIAQKAQTLLDNMKLGSWQVVEAFVKVRQRGSETEYSVCVNAVPSFQGVPAVASQQYGRDEDPMSAVSFEFSANGDFIRFDMNAPLDEAENPQTVAMPADAALEKVKEQLKNGTIYEDYGAPKFFCQRREEKRVVTLNGKVAITESSVAMGRMKTGEGYTYIPLLCLSGKADYFDEKGNLSFGTGNPFGQRIQPILWVNLLDGTIVRPD